MKYVVKLSPSVVALVTIALTFVITPSFAQDLSNPGGDLTTPLPGRHALQTPAPNVSGQNNTDQLAGFGPFHKSFFKSDGVGPFFNNKACGGCHFENGKGVARVPKNKNRFHTMLVKVGLTGVNDDGSPINIPDVGEQLQEKSVSKRKRRFNVRLRWTRVRGTYPDGTRYRLRKPILRYRIRGIRRKDTVASLRMTPGLVGLGLLEAIPEAEILALSDPDDSNEDGISGRPQYIPDLRTNGLALGRFGFRGSHPSVEQQSAAAAFNDMGLTTTLFNPSDAATEIADEVLRVLTIYQQLAGVPNARNQSDPDVIAGKSLFQSIGCNDCHVMTFVTEHAGFTELDGQTIHPFTDLLLHDMGEDLADTRAEFSASGSEWRTTPLWGLGHLETITRRNIQYLHDGRAKTVEEAILWHGGEAEAARDRFKNLSAQERDQLIAFLRSL